MLKFIIEKELREIIGSRKFAVTFGICATLIVLAFYVGARNYQVSRAQYEAALQENIRQMSDLTDWLMVEHRVFLPPEPLAALVGGVSNDIGRNVLMYGRGELTAEDSRYGDDPIFAVFRFLDLEFIFTIILSLFAILFAYDAVNGEKERGTLRLTFANAIPKDSYILGKVTGAFLALGLPLLLAMLIGSLLLPLMGVPMASSDWAKLALISLAGLLFFGVFLTLSVWISALTRRSANAFLLMLVIWIFAVMIIPRSAVLLAGRSVDVLSVDEMNAQKSRFRSQLWKEDKDKMKSFRPENKDDVQATVQQFQKFMQELAESREEKSRELSLRLQEQRRNGQTVQENLALGLARLSPAASFSLAATHLAGTSISMKQDYLDAANNYQQSYANFMKEKTGGMLREGGMIIRTITEGGEAPPKIDPYEIPAFEYRSPELRESLAAALPDFGLLALLNIICFAGAFFSFLRYDVR